MTAPHLQTCHAEVPVASPGNVAHYGLPDHGSTLFAGVVRPKSRGFLSLRSANPIDPVDIHANLPAHPDDLKTAVAAVQLCREIGNPAPLRPYARREVIPGPLIGTDQPNLHARCRVHLPAPNLYRENGARRHVRL